VASGGPGWDGPGWGGAPEQFSPDDEATQVVGPLGLGGFGQEQPADPGRRRTAATAVLAVVGLVVLVAVGGVLAVHAFFGGSPAGPATRTSAPPSAPASSGPAGVPSGFSRYQHAGGFSVAVPQGWQPQVKPRGVVDVRDPGSSRFLRLIRTSGGGDPRAQLAAAEVSFQRDHQDYHRVRLTKIDYRGYSAADWEFTYSNGGETRRVLYRSFQVSGSGYAIYLSAPAAQWADSRRFFDIATTTFDRG
jgi:hypothetical protein